MHLTNKFAHTTKKPVTAFYTRHRFLCRMVAAGIIFYGIVRIFFTPPLLSGTHFSTAYYDRDGQLLRLTLAADDKYRLFTPLAEISPDIIRATILYEDKYFRIHPGINPVSLAMAIKNYISGNSSTPGASTITMQVARMKYGLNTRRPAGKLIQIAAAIYIDSFHSKDEILETYLNLAPYGGNIEGIGAASLIYFHKRATTLSTIESITLSTIPQNPRKRGLNTVAGRENIRAMRSILTEKWIVANPAAAEAVATFADMPLNVHGTDDLPFYAPHFVDRAIGRRDNYNNSKSEITTTLDLKLQQALERKLRAEITRRKHTGIENAAAIVVNYKTMEVLAHIGSAAYFDKSIFGENDGVAARRSPGSTLKPLIYAAAADMGFIHGMTLMKDAKINFGVYAPENADNEFYGPILARDALTHSRNVPAINLVRKIGTRNFYKLLVDCGVTGLRPPEHYGISIALGGAEISMQELAGIYATMANLGKKCEIKTELNTNMQCNAQLLSPEAFFLTLDMLARQASPTKSLPFAKTRTRSIRHYWKTGTSSSFRDAWTAGIFGDYVLIVWVGNFDGRPNNSFSGARTAAPMYFSLADTIVEYDATRGIPVKNNNFLTDDMNIAQTDMCDGVGGIAGPHCPKTIKAYFIPGKSPIDVSPVYRAVPIDKKTGLRACTRDPATTIDQVYEFWDAEYLDMFRRAGIRRNTPPRFMENCNLDTVAAMRAAPIIVSPADATRLVITTGQDNETVTFQAITDDAKAKIFWFIDDAMIGTTRSGEILRHTVPMGEHTVRATDEMGAGASADFTIVK